MHHKQLIFFLKYKNWIGNVKNFQLQEYFKNLIFCSFLRKVSIILPKKNGGKKFKSANNSLFCLKLKN